MNYFNQSSYLTHIFRNILWLLGIPLFLVAAVFQEINALEDSYVTNSEFLYSIINLFFLVVWIALKPNVTGCKVLKDTEVDFEIYHQSPDYSKITKARTIELRKDHIISQLHVLPFPYLSQIYHLLNLKHLETVHGNSLSGLKVTEIHDFKSTALGGSVKFKTIVSSPINILKIWRKSTIDVTLTLHSPHMVELNVPVYGDKKMIVLFKVFPFGIKTHKFLVDIYTDLPYPKFLLRSILHFAALFTIYEDIPYLKKLSGKDWDFKVTGNSILNPTAMCLLKRFVNLYGSDLKLFQEV
ncbi:MAG: hypothetical protein HC849_28395 [Oscillatoriales cyanobacterium RU_3_3]|nr:hypothetical protein [Oscillatoriales cyanobacterium RU_3_3]